MRTPSPYDFGEPVGDPVKIDNSEILIVNDLCVNPEEDVLLLDTTTGDLILEEPEVIWSVKTLADDVYDDEWTESPPSKKLFGGHSKWRSSAHGKIHYATEDTDASHTAANFHYGDEEDTDSQHFEYDVLNQEILTQEVLKLKKEFE